jgi:type I restriction enzyme S subunit
MEPSTSHLPGEGYKRTDVGVIPTDWEVKPLHSLAEKITVGIANAATHAYRDRGVVMFRNQNIKPNHLDDRDVLYIDELFEQRYRNKRLKAGDLLTARTGYPGTTSIVPARYDGAQTFTTLITRPRKTLIDPQYLCFFINSDAGQRYIEQSQAGGGQKNVNAGSLKFLNVALPPTMAEQKSIAEVLSDADALVDSIEQLLAKKRQLKQGAMQELLTGRKRLPGFSEKWAMKRIAEVASPSSAKNDVGDHLPVLTCSKHLGFVESLAYFKNQIFSRDTSGYKIIKRGQIGYPSNHVEEGSIGLQDLHGVALVSPIYVVFSVTEQVDSYFLHRLLKLDSYRQTFATATSSSVDRRGSLRWRAFSQITVNLPGLQEQVAIAHVLRDMEAETTEIAANLAKARHLREGMMQELLTGRIRLT